MWARVLDIMHEWLENLLGCYELLECYPKDTVSSYLLIIRIRSVPICLLGVNRNEVIYLKCNTMYNFLIIVSVILSS